LVTEIRVQTEVGESRKAKRHEVTKKKLFVLELQLAISMTEINKKCCEK
jgi:hypothetical protein